MNESAPAADVRTLLRDHVRRQVSTLQTQYARPGQQPTSHAAAVMAALRRADPSAPGDDPAVWEQTLAGMPEALMGRGDSPSRSEAAAHAAICLYAVHQASRTDMKHRAGVRFGQAVRQLAKARATGTDLDPPIVKRFHEVGVAGTAVRRLSVLRSLLQLMRAESSPSIGLDYGLLALDLYDLADPRRAAGVRLAWGRDLHRVIRDADPNDGDQPPTDSAIPNPDQE